MKTETPTYSEFHNGAKAPVEQILGLEEINQSIRARLRQSNSGIPLETLTV